MFCVVWHDAYLHRVVRRQWRPCAPSSMGAAISYLQLLFAAGEVSLLTLTSRPPFESPETAVTACRASTPGSRPPLCGLSGALQQQSDLCAS